MNDADDSSQSHWATTYIQPLKHNDLNRTSSISAWLPNLRRIYRHLLLNSSIRHNISNWILIMGQTNFLGVFR